MQRKVGPLSESIGGSLSNTSRHDTETKLRTYAALAAHGRARRSPSSGESGGSRTELAPGGPNTSAFFKLPHAQQQQQVPGPRQHRGTPLIGSVTPPSCRPPARFASDTPDSAACPFAEVDDDILFQMSGLKPLRTSSRIAAAAAAAATAATPQGARSQCKAARRMCSAVKVETRPAEPMLDPAAESDAQHASIFTRAFATSNDVSPRDGDPAPTAVTDGALPTRKGTVAGEPRCGLPVLSSPDRIRPAAVQAEVNPAEGSPGSDAAAKAAGAAAAAAEAGTAGAAPGWSEELLNWMLNEKAGLLMEAQRAARRQQELEAELGKLRARGSGTEREAQHLAVSCLGCLFMAAEQRPTACGTLQSPHRTFCTRGSKGLIEDLQTFHQRSLGKACTMHADIPVAGGAPGSAEPRSAVECSRSRSCCASGAARRGQRLPDR